MDTIHVTGAHQGEHWLVGTDVVTIKASGQDTSGNLLVLEVTVRPATAPRPFIGTRTRRLSVCWKANSSSTRWTGTTHRIR
jgi:hypothetical protein